MSKPVRSHTYTHIVHTPHRPHKGTHVLCCVVVCGLSTLHTMRITDAPPLSVSPWNALETSRAIHNIGMTCTITNTRERVK